MRARAEMSALAAEATTCIRRRPGIKVLFDKTGLDKTRLDRFRWQWNRRRAPVALIVLVLAFLLAAGWARIASYFAGEDLLTKPSSFSEDHQIFVMVFVQAGTPVDVIPISGDNLGLCLPIDGEPDVYLLGRNSDGAYVLTFRMKGGEESEGRVMFLRASDYGVVSSLSQFGGCIKRAIYQEPSASAPGGNLHGVEGLGREAAAARS